MDALSKLDGNGMKDKKIRELANKCKTLNIAFEKEKTMYASFHLLDVGDWSNNLQHRLKLQSKHEKVKRKAECRWRRRMEVGLKGWESVGIVAKWRKRLWR